MPADGGYKQYILFCITRFGLLDNFSMTAASIPQASAASILPPQAGIYVKCVIMYRFVWCYTKHHLCFSDISINCTSPAAGPFERASVNCC